MRFLCVFVCLQRGLLVTSRNGVYVCICIYIYVCIYIYIHTYCFSNNILRSKKDILHATLNFSILEMASEVPFDKLDLYVQILFTFHLISPDL